MPVNNISGIRTALQAFIESDKFKTYGHLQPAVANSTGDTIVYVETQMNMCGSELLAHLETARPQDATLKMIVRKYVEEIEDAGIDTEDREFCGELFFVISKIIGVDIEDHSISMEEKLLKDLKRLAEKAGLNFEDLLKDMREKDFDDE